MHNIIEKLLNKHSILQVYLLVKGKNGDLRLLVLQTTNMLT